jgi:ATP-dependent DNA helicase DinG
MTLAAPPDLGLPPKFSAWRPLQLHAIRDGLESSKRFVAQILGTGSGKSLASVLQSSVAGRGVYLTYTKALQTQLMEDFADFGMRDIRGRSNYICTYGADGMTCEDGALLGCKAHKEGACEYVNSLAAAKDSRLAVTNYAYWMAVNRYGEGLGPADILICDEADSAVDAICNMLTVELSNRELHTLQMHPPADVNDFGSWKIWAADASGKNKTKLEALAEILKQQQPQNVDVLRGVKMHRMLEQKFATLLAAAGRWIADSTYDYANGSAVSTGFRFDPVWPARESESYLFRGLPRILLTTATMTRRMCTHVLGIDEQELDFFQYPPVFDPRRAPITWVRGSGRIDKRADSMTIRGWASRLDQIIRAWDGAKGIIHCNSYDRQRDFCELSREKKRLIWHNSWNAQQKIEEFRQSSPDSGRVLVSPAVTAGYDFPDDMCRFNVIAKIPMLDTRSKISKARMEEDGLYADMEAVKKLEQACGRPVRSEDDWCATYICDDHWAWWWPKMRRQGLFTPGFEKRVQPPTDGIPVVEF